MLKPFVKWAGGKRQLLGEIRKYLPANIKDYTYYEPFVGAGALLFDLQPKRAIINDSNAELIMCYKAIKENVDALITLLKTHEKLNCKEYYYEQRNIRNNFALCSSEPSIEKAARLIYLNKTCYNGLYRVNSKGFFNVPFGRYKNPAICEETLLHQISEYFNSSDITILNEDFEQTVSKAGENSFIYFDPPYHSPEKANFTSYQAGGFNEKEQLRLRDIFIELTKRGVKCLLSNADTAFIRNSYIQQNTEIITIQAKRAINSNSAGRGNVNELLIKNWGDSHQIHH